MKRLPMVGALLASVVCTAAEAQNYVPNGSFDQNVDGWSAVASGGLLTWQSDDAAHDPASGSGKITMTLPDTTFESSACIPAFDGLDLQQSADYGGRVSFVSHAPNDVDAAASIRVYFFNALDCVGSPLGAMGTGILVDSTAGYDQWIPVYATTPLSGHLSARIRLNASYSGSPAQVDVAFDGIVFGQSGLVPLTLFSSGFE